jgi:branched-chain amino acid transport system ATP-binding protein
MPDTLLSIEGLHGGYGAVQVLHGVSLQVRRGEVVALLGANGAGKSTLINTACRLVSGSAGAVRFDGHDITRARPQDIVGAGLIQVPEGRRIFPNLTVQENLELGACRRATRQRKANLARVLETFPRLRERLGQHAGTMSGGEQQMLAIGRGLMGDPRLLILDEPSLGLSPLMVEEMFRLVRRLHQQGLSILLVEQNVALSLEIAARAYVLEHGAVRFCGTPQALLEAPELRAAYLGT